VDDHQKKSEPKLFLHPLTLQVIGTGAGVGVDSAWEQEKLEARKILENAAESPASSARFVGRFLPTHETFFRKGDSHKADFEKTLILFWVTWIVFSKFFYLAPNKNIYPSRCH